MKRFETLPEFHEYLGKGRTAFTFRTVEAAVACAERRIAIGMDNVEVAQVADESGDIRYCVVFAVRGAA